MYTLSPSIDRQVQKDSCSSSSNTLDLAIAADAFHAFTHAEQAEVPTFSAILRLRLESLAVIYYGDTDTVCAIAEFELDALGLSVNDSIMQRFARRHQQFMLEVLIERHRNPSYMEGGRSTKSLRHTIEEHSKRMA